MLHDKNLFYLVSWLESTRVCQSPGDGFQLSSLKDIDFNMKLQFVNNLLFLMIKTLGGHRNVDMETVNSVLAFNNVLIDALKTLCGEPVNFSKEPPPASVTYVGKLS